MDPGRTLHHYRIVGRLGAGGMGEVYAAEDTKLGRRVALKVLPPETAADAEHLHRFQREARAVAALNHPNIVTIYSVEESEGLHFLTMELVEGRTLAEIVPPGGLPLDALFDVALPLVEAVAFAHDHGIVHRDLKPANVMLAGDGRVKVLDFGLAKLKLVPAPTDTTRLFTQSLTEEHAVVGTAAYMSPEQAEGRPVDHRSDIFSLGIVLYEMACGRRPFGGDSFFSMISSLLKDTPAPLSSVNRAAPPALDRILSRALAKDPGRRYQTAIQLRRDLEMLRQQGAATRLVSGAFGALRRSRAAWWLAGAGAVVAAGAAALSLVPWRPAPEAPAAPTTFRNTRLTSDPGIEQFPSLMPDGKWVVYAGQKSGNWDIYLQPIPGQNAVNLTADSAADDDEPALSPDGERIAFRSSRDGGGIFVMGRGGENVRRVTPAGSPAFNPTWSSDGTALAYTTENVQLKPLNWEGRSELWVVNVTTGERRSLAVEDAVQPAWSPHGHRIAYVARQWREKTEGGGFGSKRMEIATIPARGGEPVAVTNDKAADWCPAWSPDGRHVYFVSDRGGSMNLWRVPVDEASGKALGEPEQITTPAPFLAHPRVSAAGLRIAYSAVIQEQRVQRLVVDPATGEVRGEPAWVTSGSRAWANPDPAPDGESVVFYSVDQPEGDLYSCRADGTGLNRLTEGDTNRMPVWSPDRKWVAFSSDRSGALDLWRIQSDGSGLQHLGEGFIAVWSPDGTRLATSVPGDAEGRTDVFPVRDAGGGARQPLPLPAQALRPFIAVAWSPDQSRLAGQIGFSDRGGNGIVLYSFASRTYERLTDFGEWPAWLPDSRHIFFVNRGREFWVVDTRTRQATLVYSTTRDVLGPPRLTRDGRSVYFSRRTVEADIHLLSFQ